MSERERKKSQRKMLVASQKDEASSNYSSVRVTVSNSAMG